jgi:L-cysteine/cystine lyase
MLTDAHPTVIGWRSLQDETRAVADDPDPFHHDSRRFEVATSCVPLMAGLRCSLDLLEQEGSDGDRLERIRTLSEQLWRDLQSLGGISPLLEGPPPAGLVSFQMHPEATRATPSEVVKALGTKQIWIRDLADPICLRACTHICTKHSDMAQLIDQIRMLSAMGS